MSNLYSAHMTMPESMAKIDATHLGQAHFGGTGPEGTTCRQCSKWGLIRQGSDKVEHTYVAGCERGMMVLDRQKCRHPIANKADRRVPHEAQSCIFFAENETPPVIERKKLTPNKKSEA